MAAAKKSVKGNKTAHVLNLLTAPGEAAPAPAEGDAEAPAQEAAQPAAPSRPLLPPILEVAQANDDNLAQQIQQALEDELTAAAPPAPQPEPAAPVEEPPAPQPATAPAPAGGTQSPADLDAMLAAPAAPVEEPPAPQPAPAPAPSGGKMSQEEIEAMLAAAAAPVEESPAPQPKPEPAPAPKQAEPNEDDDIIYVNVMQTLVEEKAPGYIKKFGLCDCKHCLADVKALTLSNLVPKYVVLSKLDRIPMLTVYEGRYNSTIFAQLTRACKVVMDHPHHNRE